jgi:hypothetical protein
MPQRASGECPQCESATLTAAKGSSLVVSCTQCEWSVDTTNHNQPQCDLTSYKVFVFSERLASAQSVARLAVEVGIPSARAILSERLPLNESANAETVLHIYRRVHGHGFSVCTEPPFPRPLAEA